MTAAGTTEDNANGAFPAVPTVLVTGAFGQVGRRVTQVLLDRGRRVIAMDLGIDKVLTRANELALSAPAGRLTPVFANVLDADAVRQVVVEHQPEAIVHLAAIYAPPSYRNPQLARRVNIDGTRRLLAAARNLSRPPLVVFASSAAVFGSRNPYCHPELITSRTPANPVDQYGEDKILAEGVIAESGLPYAILRLAGVISPDGAANLDKDYFLLMRATPGDNRLHTVDCRDVGLAFANAVDRADAVSSKVLLIGGDDSHRHTHRDVEDDMLQALGLGRLGESASLPGDPNDERGWSYTGWFDTTESQQLLEFQRHSWPDTVAWVAASQTHLQPVLKILGPVLRPAMRLALAGQRRWERRGPYADPWSLIVKVYGSEVLTSSRDACQVHSSRP